MALRLHNPFDERDIVTIEVTGRMLLGSHRVVLIALDQLGQERVIPELRRLRHESERADAFAHLAYRLGGLVEAAPKLYKPETVQALAGVARSIFEIAMDIALLGRESVSDGIEKFVRFTVVERLRAAKSVVNVYEEKGWDLSEIEDQLLFCRDSTRAASVEATVDRLWGRNRKGYLNWPRHWSGQDAAGRARLLGNGWIKTNHRVGDMLAWQIHGGAVGLTGITQDGMVGLFVTLAEVITDHVPSAYRVVASEFGFGSTDLNDDLEFISNRLATVAVIDQQRQAVGHSSRLAELGIVG